MPYTIVVLQALAAQFVVGFAAAMVTANKSHRANYWRRFVLRVLWALTGWLLLVAIIWDVFQLIRG